MTLMSSYLLHVAGMKYYTEFSLRSDALVCYATLVHGQMLHGVKHEEQSAQPASGELRLH